MYKEGSQIGSYILKSQIGSGSFGVVWLAEETTFLSSHIVALKLPGNAEVNIEMIRQEAVLWEQVKGHPNILPIIKADMVDNQIYIASEYAPDGSLADWMSKNHGSAPNSTAQISAAIYARTRSRWVPLSASKRCGLNSAANRAVDRF